MRRASRLWQSWPGARWHKPYFAGHDGCERRKRRSIMMTGTRRKSLPGFVMRFSRSILGVPVNGRVTVRCPVGTVTRMTEFSEESLIMSCRLSLYHDIMILLGGISAPKQAGFYTDSSLDGVIREGGYHEENTDRCGHAE